MLGWFKKRKNAPDSNPQVLSDIKDVNKSLSSMKALSPKIKSKISAKMNKRGTKI